MLYRVKHKLFLRHLCNVMRYISKVTNKILKNSRKKTRVKIENFIIKSTTGNKRNHTIEVSFCFIPISQLNVEI